MKKNLLFAALFLFCVSASAQFINGFTILPSNPTTNDHIQVLANMSFSSGGCADHQQSVFQSGNVFSASALHCLGPLSFICSYSDTFAIGVLPAGNYHFNFQVNAGGGPSPCSPGIVPGPSDSVSFTVSQAAAIAELSEQNISIHYNLQQHKIVVQLGRALSNGKINLFSLTGQLLQTAAINTLSASMSAAGINAGLYIVEIASDKGRYTQRLLIQE